MNNQQRKTDFISDDTMEGDECTTVEIARLHPKKFEKGHISYIFRDLRDVQRWPGTKTA